nr:transposase family protein [Kitasatospora aureofaciens]
MREVVGLLAARAPRLDRALKKIARSGGGVVLLDGSLVRTRRRTGTENRKNYSGKHKCHGLLVIALTDDQGRLAWVSAVRPGRTSEITACRHDKLTAHLRAAGLGAIADLGFVGLDDSAPDTDPAVITGYKAARNRPLTGAGPAGPDEPGSRPLTDDLHRSHTPMTSPSTPTPTHTRTRDLPLHDAHHSLGSCLTPGRGVDRGGLVHVLRAGTFRLNCTALLCILD